MMAQLTLPIICVGLLLLWATKTEASALSDVDECSWFKCPEKPEAAEVAKCPDDSSFRSDVDNDDEESDKSESDYYFQLETLPLKNLSRDKRDTPAYSIDLLELCCGATQSHNCSCNKCGKKPHCKADQVLFELSQGNGKPGNCCTKYDCGPEPACEAGASKIYWLDSCTKCNSCNLPRCTYVCNPMELSPPGNCLTDDNRPMLNGDSWTQGDGCEKCICKDGQKECTTPYCKQPECENAIKMPGECCPTCPVPEPTTESTKAPTTTKTNTTTTTEGFSVSTTEGAMEPSSSSTSTEISTMETIENATETILEENTIHENPLEDHLPTSTTISSSSISEETELDETTTTNFSTEEDTTEISDMDNTDINDSSSSSSIIISSTSSPLEHQKSVATSAPAARLPESTSWHRDSTIDDADYRFANENHSDAVHQSQKRIIWMTAVSCVIAAVFILLLVVYFRLKKMEQRKHRLSRYSSVPCSESNISEHTNISEKTNTTTSDLLIVRIEQPYQTKKQLEETLE